MAAPETSKKHYKTGACISLIAAKYTDVPAMVVFDRIEKVESKLLTARSYADSDKHIFPGLCDSVATSGLPKPLTSRDVPALQAADLVAWESRKAHFNMKEWQLSERPAGDRFERWQNYLDWTRERTGGDPVLRKSLDALIGNDRVKFVVWDHQQLTTSHQARRGIWTEAA